MFLTAIADPNLALLLLVLGLLGIYVEFSSPGLIAPGVIGAILVTLGVRALSLMPIDGRGVALMTVALVFMGLEAKLATRGILTAAAALALFGGAVMLIDSNDPARRIHPAVAAGLTVPFALISSFLLSIAIRARRNKVTTGLGSIVGASAVAIGDIDSSGTVMFHGEYWNARAAGHIGSSEKVRISGIDGLTLQVEKLRAESRKEL